MSVPHLSVVSPVYLGAALVPELVARIRAAVEPLGGGFEIVLVDDGSPDDSWTAIRMAAAADGRVRGVRLARNYGQHPAILAGLAAARGEWVAVLDCDLQDPPEAIPALLLRAEGQGYDYVVARRQERQHGALQRLTSALLYGAVRLLGGPAHDPAVANFGVYSRGVVAAVLARPERPPFFPLLVRRTGRRGGALAVPHAAREARGSTYSWARRLRLGLQVARTFGRRAPRGDGPAGPPAEVAETI